MHILELMLTSGDTHTPVLIFNTFFLRTALVMKRGMLQIASSVAVLAHMIWIAGSEVAWLMFKTAR